METEIERHTHGLLTGDSLYLDNMNRHNSPIRHIVTRDSDFFNSPSITAWAPQDVVG